MERDTRKKTMVVTGHEIKYRKRGGAEQAIIGYLEREDEDGIKDRRQTTRRMRGADARKR